MIKFWKNIKETRKNTVTPLDFPQKVLIAPLDWGLGHTTRCISIIRYLQQKSCQIFIAANQQQTVLLQQELHDVTFLSLDGYNISYSRAGRNFAMSIASQIPGLLFSIHREHRWLKKKQREYGFNLIISDNRFGMYHSKIFSVFITHQLGIRSGISKKTDRLVNWWNHRWIQRFNECWVPDLHPPYSLAGELSHPATMPANVKYIGPLSRFQSGAGSSRDHLLVVISGPEPQRSIFEALILSQIRHYQGKVVVIRGIPGSHETIATSDNITVYNHVPSSTFEQLLRGAGMVICRSGYSSIMDLVLTGKKAILIPTPGQTEQEYLARHLHDRRIFYTVDQSKFDLEKNIEDVKHFPFESFTIPFDDFKKVIDDLPKRIL